MATLRTNVAHAPADTDEGLRDDFPDGFADIFSENTENQDENATEPKTDPERHESTSIDVGDADVNDNVPPVNSNSLPVSKGPNRVFTQEAIPQEMRERGILTGYRSPDQLWSFYLKSLFWMHNETLNIWISLVTPLFLFLMYKYVGRYVDFDTNASAQGLRISMVSSLIAFVVFAVARTLRNKNIQVQNIVMGMNYAGVAIFLYGQMIMYFYSSGTASFYSAVRSVFPGLIFALSLGTLICNMVARAMFSNSNERRKTLQIVPMGICIVLGFLPIYFSRVHQCRKFGGFFGCVTDVSVILQFCVGIIIIPCALAAFYYHYPEKSNPGKYDRWGNSHNLGFVAAVLGVLMGQYACSLDLTNEARVAFDIIQPDGKTMWITFVVFCTFVGTMLCISLVQSVEVPKEKKTE